MKQFGLIAVVLALAGCNQQADTGGGAGSEVTFAASIMPIVEERCAKCHIEDKKGELSMTSLETVLAGGKSGPVVVPGDAASSRMYKLVAGLDPEKKMPPRGEPLTGAQIASIKAWIDGGAK